MKAVTETLRSGWLSTGPKTREFERAFSRFVGSKGALALNSCTAGLHLALKALDIGPGDEVITTTMTFCATVNVIEHVGATPVLVDVESDTLNLDPDRVEQAITAQTKAIIAVHFGGHPCEMDDLRRIARDHDLRIIEDAAHALPASYRGQTIGTIADLTAFSFYATKNLTTGEGGMLTGSPDFLEKARIESLHGMNRDAWRRYDRGGSWYYEVTTPGYKYNMTDIAAAIGLAQLKKLPGFQRRRREIVKRYNAAFATVPFFELPVERSHVESAWHLYVLRIRPETLRIDRDAFLDEMGKRMIGTSVHFIPVHVHPYYRERYGFAPDSFPVAYDSYQRQFSLPLHPGLTDDEVGDVIDAVIGIADHFRR